MTKIILCFLAFSTMILSVNAQDSDDIDALLRQGILMHEEGNYVEAIRIYKQALDIIPDSPIINSEIAMSYLYNGANEEAIVYANKALSLKGGNFYGVYITKGSALRNLNRLEEAEKIFKQGLSATGENFMLHYSLGQVYYLQNKNIEASKEFVSAIQLQANHANSHLLLAYSMLDLGKRNEGLLGLLYFLLFESDTDRAEEAFLSIWEEFHNPKTIDEYTAQLSDFLRILSKNRNIIVENKILDPFWNDFYMPFFDMIFREGYATVFALHIASPFSKDANKLLKDKSDTYKQFLNILESDSI